MSARPDVFQAKEAIHQNPAGALAPVPLMGLPLLLENLGRQNSQEVLDPTSRITPLPDRAISSCQQSLLSLPDPVICLLLLSDPALCPCHSSSATHNNLLHINVAVICYQCRVTFLLSFWKKCSTTWTLYAMPAVCSSGHVEFWCEDYLDRPSPYCSLASLLQTVLPTPTCCFLSMMVAQYCPCLGQGPWPKVACIPFVCYPFPKQEYIAQCHRHFRR